MTKARRCGLFLLNFHEFRRYTSQADHLKKIVHPPLSLDIQRVPPPAGANSKRRFLALTAFGLARDTLKYQACDNLYLFQVGRFF